MSKNLFLTLLFGFLAIACGSNADEQAQNIYNPQLPPITTTGANTFGCKINGVVMVPRNSIGIIAPPGNHYPVITAGGINNEYLYIQASDRRETNRGGVFLYLQNIAGTATFQTGEYEIFDGIAPSFLNDNYNNYIYVTAYKNGVAHNYKSIAGTGKIIISKNDNMVFSGTFSCKVKNVNDPNDIIDISEGRFDFGININTTNFP